ncbi:hypothetical protein BGZ93_004151 [Podila epicladia]|nr:hypothetical protein BGZ92_004454 [Podila epicladia]KAG0096687.1 hypothetical protein BGZ93_004151 [Podila epicladia]
MTRAGKSYRSSTPKEPKEPKREKIKRLENYRVAKAQAKKFVIPGLIAVLASIFFLFVAMYGFKGTKLQRRERAQDMLFNADKVANTLNKDALTQQILAAMKNQASDVFGEKSEEVEFEPQEKKKEEEEPEKV